ncbi:Acetyltransferase (GNAT) family protein [Planctomycetes bacterium MalM25]|nr:Acetyltransferase (GNAT) family protein [Planctomycetes bacterium MalM25]
MPFQVVDQLTESQTVELTRLYQGEWWTQGRPLDEVHDMLAASDVVIGLVDDDQHLVGFCRVLTDFVFRGTLYDVIVDPDYRGQGLGRQLLDAVAEHPRLARLEKLYLACKPEMAGFYAAANYQPVGEALVWMSRRQRTL